MSILSGFIKTKKYRLLDSGNYKLQSEWTSSDTVYIGETNVDLNTELQNIENAVADHEDAVKEKYRLRTYSSFPQLEQDPSNATIPQIVKAMDNSSIAVLTLDGKTCDSRLCPNGIATNGTIIIHKQSGTRSLLFFETPGKSSEHSAKLYQGSFYITSEEMGNLSEGTWSGWKKVMTADNFEVNGTTLNITTT